jgi:hypothetical protein
MSIDELDAKKREKLIASIEEGLESLGMTLEEARKELDEEL